MPHSHSTHLCQNVHDHTMQACEARKCILTEDHIIAPNKIEIQILRNTELAHWVASHCLCLDRKEWDSSQSMSYTFPNHIGKRRKSNPKPLVLSEARKQLMIYRLPQVLRLHLKRFRWACAGASQVAVNWVVVASKALVRMHVFGVGRESLLPRDPLLSVEIKCIMPSEAGWWDPELGFHSRGPVWSNSLYSVSVLETFLVSFGLL